MLLDYGYNAANKVLSVRAAGCVTMEDRYGVYTRILADPQLPTDCSFLFDVSGIENAPSETDVAAIEKLNRVLLSRFAGRMAMVNNRVGHVTISHLLATGLASARFETFLDEREARAWLRTVSASLAG